MKQFRNEWQYIIDGKSVDIIKSRLDAILSYDEYSNNGLYLVHNIYFDDYKNTSALKTEAGDAKRFKWRIRYYGNDTKTLKLECKQKLYGRCYKKTCNLTMKEYKAIMRRDSNLIWNTNKELVKKFYVDMMNKYYIPKVIIDYERIAYVDKTLNIRITFDKNISASYEYDKFLKGNYIKIPIQEKNTYILEVKFDNILPSYIKNMIESVCNLQTSFSKYYNGRKILEVLK